MSKRWGETVIALAKAIDNDSKHAKVSDVLMTAAAYACEARPPWWRWSVYMAVALTLDRTKRILATGKDPWLLTAQI